MMRRDNNPSTREALALVSKWAGRFGLLPTWRISVRVNRTADECASKEHRDDQAFVSVDDGGFQATVEVNAYKLEDPLDEVIAHEVFHIVSWRVAQMAESGAGRLRGVVEAEVEDMVERTGRVLARLAGKGRK
jgi:hypothetical protein